MAEGICRFCNQTLDSHCFIPAHWHWIEFPATMTGRAQDQLLRLIEERGYACPVLTGTLPACTPVRKPSA